MFSLAAFDVDNEKREVCHRASGASVAFYACPEEDWRANPGNFAMHRKLGSLDSSDITSFDAGALSAPVAGQAIGRKKLLSGLLGLLLACVRVLQRLR